MDAPFSSPPPILRTFSRKQSHPTSSRLPIAKPISTTFSVPTTALLNATKQRLFPSQSGLSLGGMVCQVFEETEAKQRVFLFDLNESEKSSSSLLDRSENTDSVSSDHLPLASSESVAVFASNDASDNVFSENVFVLEKDLKEKTVTVEIEIPVKRRKQHKPKPTKKSASSPLSSYTPASNKTISHSFNPSPSTALSSLQIKDQTPTRKMALPQQSAAPVTFQRGLRQCQSPKSELEEEESILLGSEWSEDSGSHNNHCMTAGNDHLTQGTIQFIMEGLTSHQSLSVQRQSALDLLEQLTSSQRNHLLLSLRAENLTKSLLERLTTLANRDAATESVLFILTIILMQNGASVMNELLSLLELWQLIVKWLTNDLKDARWKQVLPHHETPCHALISVLSQWMPCFDQMKKQELITLSQLMIQSGCLKELIQQFDVTQSERAVSLLLIFETLSAANQELNEQILPVALSLLSALKSQSPERVNKASLRLLINLAADEKSCSKLVPDVHSMKSLLQFSCYQLNHVSHCALLSVGLLLNLFERHEQHRSWVAAEEMSLLLNSFKSLTESTVNEVKPELLVLHSYLALVLVCLARETSHCVALKAFLNESLTETMTDAIYFFIQWQWSLDGKLVLKRWRLCECDERSLMGLTGRSENRALQAVLLLLNEWLTL